MKTKDAKSASPTKIGDKILAEDQGAETPPEVTPARKSVQADMKVPRPR
jgi:hypothetical protein